MEMQLLHQQQVYFKSQATKSLSFRLEALQRLKNAIKIMEEEICQALYQDLNKSTFDSFSTEIGMVYHEISYMSKHLKSWMKPIRVKSALTHIGTTSKRYPEPYGSVLIIAPWNYPFQLAILPLIGAIAAGNCAVIKPSELSPSTSAVVTKLIDSVFPPEYIKVFEGDVAVNQALLALPFNYIFFTGSVAVGKIVMQAAAAHLTPVTLELGGKSPCIVHADANLQLAAKRIAWGKFLNAGQTCIAPDYLYVHSTIYDQFMTYLVASIKEIYTNNALYNTDYVRIISPKHFDRLLSFLEKDKIVMGGQYDEANLKIAPTVLTDIKWTDAVMQEEIFGPLLPVLLYDELNEVIEVLNDKPTPLALYLFSRSSTIANQVIAQVEFGGGCINDVLYHVANNYLPFGGKGSSGMGAYHGKCSFDTFTHYKSVLNQRNRLDIPFRYPNHKYGLRILKLLFK